MIENILVTPLKKIDTLGGDVMHAMKSSDKGYCGFGEAYFSKISECSIKGWKRHKEMTLNIIVPKGSIKFVFFDDLSNFSEPETFREIILSEENYKRISVPPMVWMGFKGLGKNYSLLLNIANIEHDDKEVEKIDLEKMKYNWRK